MKMDIDATNMKTDLDHGTDKEQFIEAGFNIDSGKLGVLAPVYKGDDNWILLDENNQFYHKNNITAKTAFTHSKTTADPGYNGTFKILDFKYDSAGHVTGL